MARAGPPGETLLEMAIRYIDGQIAQRVAESDDLFHQLDWLQQERRRLLQEAAAERARHP